MTRRTLIAAALLALSALPTAHAAIRCVDFLAFPDNAPLLEKFKLSKFKFQDRTGGFAPFVNVFTDLVGQPVHGMQFDNRGMRVAPPGPALSMELRLGAFAGPPLQIEALDSLGGVQDAAMLPVDNIMHTVMLAATTAPITEVRVRGGGNEGVLNFACAIR